MENSQDTIAINCLEVIQPIGVFYVGVINSSDLELISFADIRELDRELDDYLGIQRRLSPKRVDELRNYVNTIDATFPTSIILAISSTDVEYLPDQHIMKIRRSKEVAKIIDGQHRIKGLANYEKNNFQLNISIFVDMELEDQAMVFATINLAQTKVNKSLTYDLYEYAKSRSPQKTAHNIVRLLQNKSDSPFYQRIKILGTATPGLQKIQTITQATFVEELIKMISGNLEQALQDRETIKRNNKLQRVNLNSPTKLVFRNMFIDKEDAQIAKIVWNYFKAVEKKWPKAWNNLEVTGNILPRTNGFIALMRLLPEAYTSTGGIGTIPEVENFYEFVFSKISLKDEDLSSDRYKPGSSGSHDLLSDLRINLF